MSPGTTILNRLDQPELAFATLRALALVGGIVALLTVPPRPEHLVHHHILIGAFLLYKAALFSGLYWGGGRAHRLFVWAMPIDLGIVFLLVWFTGGFESHAYLLFYLLIALNAYHYGFGVGVAGALAAVALYGLASWITGSFVGGWPHFASRGAVFALLGVSLGFLSDRERRARAELETLNRDLEQANRDLRDAQDRLVRAERLATIGKMSTKVAHEIRNPLASMSLNAELLGDELASLDRSGTREARGLLDSIRAQIEGLNEVAEEYLRFARLPKPEVQPLDLAEVVGDLLGFMAEELASRKVRVTVDAPSALPPALADPRLLRQALMNLIRNAVEAMPDGGNLAITAARANSGSRIPDGANCLDLRVGDTGPGVPPDERERIFEPFVTTKDGGTGLGLAIARQILQEHGGELTCEPHAGPGAVFVLRLPVAPEAERKAFDGSVVR